MNKKNHIMIRKNEMALLTTGILLGAALIPTTHAAIQQLTATPSTQKFYVDGKQTQLEAYAINGNNYVKLRDIGKAVGFDVSYNSATNSVYLGTQSQSVAKGTVTLPADGSKYIPKTGDKILCDDGYIYEIADVSRWENNVFSPGPLPSLPSPTCDWSRFPKVDLPPVEVRHFSHPGQESVFVRNLYETRRMQYTIYNVLGQEPSAWRNGKLLASVSLTISPEDEDFVKASWPWRASELENLVHSRPNSRFSVEAWDYYINGVFQYTRYCVVSL